MSNMNILKRLIGHTKKVFTHKYWVAKYCFAIGLYKQGLLHDMSKFSPTEFFEGVKYYTGTASPIDACKKANGYSMAWFHHRGRNPHHFEMWIDNFDKGGEPLRMPTKYLLELICDYVGAAKAYMGDRFTWKSEWEWWQKHREKRPLYKDTKAVLDTFFKAMAKIEEDGLISTKEECDEIAWFKHCLKVLKEEYGEY